MRARKLNASKEITSIELRHNLDEILDRVAKKHQRFLIKRAGVPAAVLLNIREYENLEDLLDTWQEQQDRAFQRSLVAARREIERGKVVTLGSLRRDLRTKERRAKRRA